jgi:hypothetical protein
MPPYYIVQNFITGEEIFRNLLEMSLLRVIPTSEFLCRPVLKVMYDLVRIHTM